MTRTKKYFQMLNVNLPFWELLWWCKCTCGRYFFGEDGRGGVASLSLIVILWWRSVLLFPFPEKRFPSNGVSRNCWTNFSEGLMGKNEGLGVPPMPSPRWRPWLKNIPPALPLPVDWVELPVPPVYTSVRSSAYTPSRPIADSCRPY